MVDKLSVKSFAAARAIFEESQMLFPDTKTPDFPECHGRYNRMLKPMHEKVINTLNTRIAYNRHAYAAVFRYVQTLQGTDQGSEHIIHEAFGQIPNSDI